MHPLFFTLAVLFALAAVHAAPSGQPSGVPTCGSTCPPQDNGGFPLTDHSDDGTTLSCTYPSPAGEIPGGYYCNYSDSTGELTLDHNIGLCPATAASCATTRRRGALPRAPAPPMVAHVAREPTPDVMKVRAQLKRQVVQVEA